MTCKDVLDVVDAADGVAVPPARKEAALAHIAVCGSCAHAMSVASTMPGRLREVAVPIPAPELTSRVMARIHGRESREAAPDAGVAAREGHRRTGWQAMETLTAGALLLAGVVAGGIPLGDVLSLRTTAANGFSVPTSLWGGAALVACLFLLGAAVFAPLLRLRAQTLSPEER
jgi:hypothetical protein